MKKIFFNIFRYFWVGLGKKLPPDTPLIKKIEIYLKLSLLFKVVMSLLVLVEKITIYNMYI